MKSLIRLLTLTLLAGCATPPTICLSRDHEQNRNTLTTLIPLQTPIAEAEKILRRNDFTWVMHRNESAHLYKGSTDIGETGPPNVAICERGDGDTRWTVIVFADEGNRVSNIDITSAPNHE